MASNSNSPVQSNNFEYQKLKNNEEMKMQFWSFFISIFLTIIAFIAVAADAIPANFTAPFIIVLAIVQVIYQLFYFMHLKNKGHEAPTLFIMAGIGFATLIVVGCGFLSWI